MKNDVKQAGLKTVKRAEAYSFWEWDKGSVIYFWRWPKDYQDVACEGVAPMFKGDPPRTMEFQSPYPDDNVKVKVKAKL